MVCEGLDGEALLISRITFFGPLTCRIGYAERKIGVKIFGVYSLNA